MTEAWMQHMRTGLNLLNKWTSKSSNHKRMCKLKKKYLLPWITSQFQICDNQLHPLFHPRAQENQSDRERICLSRNIKQSWTSARDQLLKPWQTAVSYLHKRPFCIISGILQLVIVKPILLTFLLLHQLSKFVCIAYHLYIFLRRTRS